MDEALERSEANSPRQFNQNDRNSNDPALPAFSVIIPAYNEEQAVKPTLLQLRQTIPATAEWELIVVDDGSTDGTAAQLASEKGVKVIRHEVNRGYGAAIKSGIMQARYDLIVITDADGSYPNDRIPDLVKLATRFDMVVGARTGEQVSYPVLRRISKYGLSWFAAWIAQSPIPDINSGLRVFKKSVAERFLRILPDSFSLTLTITLAMLTNNYRVHFEPINYYPRLGKSKIKPIRDTLRFVQLILRTGSYFAPMRVFMPIAGLLFGGALLSLINDIVKQNLTDTTVILMVNSLLVGMFALLADMIDKRCGY